MVDEEDLIESDCVAHGLERHVCVHEAGHAVAAIDHGIDFRAVVSYDDTSAPRFMNGLYQAAAALDMSRTPQEVVEPDPRGAFRFALAGVAAERAVLGDYIPKGWDQDFRFWRSGSGTTHENAQDAIEAILGKGILEFWEETYEWAEQNAVRIEAVADVLGQQEEPWEILREQVEAILRVSA